jgi:hypothetical protein
MKKKEAIIAAFIMCLLSIGITAGLVHAAGTADVASVWVTSDQLGNIKVNTFTPGQIVWIWFNAIDSVPNPSVDIKIVDPAGNLVYQPANWIGYIGGQPLQWTPQTPGYYYIVINGAGFSGIYPIAVASVFVLPESAIGTLMAIAAGLAAVGTFRIVRSKKNKQ